MENTERKTELFASAMSNLMKDEFGLSLNTLNELIGLDSGDKLSYLARGSVYLKMSESENAIDDFNRALEIDANHPKAYHLRGLAHEMAGDNDEALRDFDRAIDIDSEYGAAFYSRASLLTKMGQEDSALEDMKMVNHLSNINVESFAKENNVWHSRQLQLEEAMESEMHR